jgi:hypothetical protein
MAIFRIIGGLLIAVLGTGMLINLGQVLLARLMPLDVPQNPTLEQIAQALERAHSTHFLALLANYIVMVALGTMLAGLVSGKPRTMAWIAGVLFVGASALNLMLIRHPAWFAALNLAGVVAAAWVGQRIARSIIARGDARRSPSPSA